jgi:nucleoside-diphosphate-sugar epimerase
MTNQDTNVILGAGPMGRAIARQLHREGRKVVIVTRGAPPPDLPEVQHRRADLMRPGAAAEACAGASTIFHCAAPAYDRWTEEFPALQDAVIDAAASTGAVLGVVENLYGYGVAGTLTEAMPLAATTRKGRVRAEMTARLFAAHSRGEVRAVAGRAADYFGPGVRVSAFGERLWQPLLAGKPISWIGDPDAPHSVTYVPDFAAALIRLVDTPSSWGRAWHVPSPAPLTPRAVIAAAAQAAGLPMPRVRRLPVLMLRAVGLFNPGAGEMVEMVYSYDRPFVMMHRDFDAAFGMAATPWDQAVAATRDWWQQSRVPGNISAAAGAPHDPGSATRPRA